MNPCGGVQGLRGISCTASDSVILIEVLLATLGGFGSPCWFGHDDLEEEEEKKGLVSGSVSLYQRKT